MPAVTIRRAGRQDAAAVRDLMTAAYAHYVERIGRRPAPMDEDYSRVLQDADAWVAEDAGRVVRAVVTYRQAGHLQLDSIASSLAGRGRGSDVACCDWPRSTPDGAAWGRCGSTPTRR